MKEMINFDHFTKLDIRIGTIKSAERIDGSSKLIKLLIDLGSETRQLIAGIGETISDLGTLIDRQIPVLINLEPKIIKGFESQGMILAVDDNDKPILLHPEGYISPESIVR